MVDSDSIIAVELDAVENILCLQCQRSVIGICPYRGHEPSNPEKVTCPTLASIRRLPQYRVKPAD